jgi:glycosyltransferase involved in cell wall biosynthesis
MALAYPMRIAPLQGWWAMKYHRCDIPDIDFHLAMENVVLGKRIEGSEWRTFGAASARWLDPALGPAARELRLRFAPDAVVAISIGRESKLNSPAFLGAVARLLQRHPRLVFLWTGKSRLGAIQSYFDAQGVSDRVHFEGWVDTKLYAQAIDLFLDSFPFPCGLALKEAMAAGKAAVMYRSVESLGTGVPGAITPVIEGTANAAPEVRAELERIFTAVQPFDLYACASSADEYVEMASRLIEDVGLRARTGAANREFVRAFLSSPEAEARKFLDHLDAIFETLPAAIETT